MQEKTNHWRTASSISIESYLSLWKGTAHNTPQQSSPVVVGFSTLSGRARAMMQNANVPKDMRKLLMPEAVKTATSKGPLSPSCDGGPKKFQGMVDEIQALRHYQELLSGDRPNQRNRICPLQNESMSRQRSRKMQIVAKNSLRFKGERVGFLSR
jgi:hypothetical protein